VGIESIYAASNPRIGLGAVLSHPELSSINSGLSIKDVTVLVDGPLSVVLVATDSGRSIATITVEQDRGIVLDSITSKRGISSLFAYLSSASGYISLGQIASTRNTSNLSVSGSRTIALSSVRSTREILSLSLRKEFYTRVILDAVGSTRGLNDLGIIHTHTIALSEVETTGELNDLTLTFGTALAITLESATSGSISSLAVDSDRFIHLSAIPSRRTVSSLFTVAGENDHTIRLGNIDNDATASLDLVVGKDISFALSAISFERTVNDLTLTFNIPLSLTLSSNDSGSIGDVGLCHIYLDPISSGSTDDLTVAVDAPPANDFLTNLNSYFKLEESSGDFTDEESTWTISRSGTVNLATGKSGNGADVSSGSNKLTGDNSSYNGFEAGVDFSYSFWWKATAIGNLLNIAGQDMPPMGDNYYARIVESSGSYAAEFGKGATTDSIDLSSDLPSTADSNWYHIVLTFSTSNGIKAYVNGSLVGTASHVYGGSMLAVRSTCDIGYGTSGIIDEWADWNGRELSSSEVSTLYNSGDGVFYDDFGT